MKLLYLLVVLPIIYAIDNGVARTPAMGWNSWNKFGCSINETLIKVTAEAIVSSGLAAVGYTYVNLDDCWQLTRDPNTKQIQPDPNAFPSGIKALADFVHALDLKFGLYSSAGTKTCQGRPGGLYYENVDAQTYAEWGVDYLKYDNCYNLDLPPKYRYPRMRDALNKTGRPIYYSLCEWGQDQPWQWASEVGNSWRTTGDINDSWNSLLGIINQSIPIANASAPGGWNDPDMLEVGNGGMTTIEYESHFALWAFMKAPLLVGCDVTNMSNDTKRILMNKEIIAVNQDPLGQPALFLNNDTTLQVWGGQIVGAYAAILFNAGDTEAEITADFSLFGLQGATLQIRDLYAGKDLGAFTGSFQASVQPHGVIVIKLTQQSEEFLPLFESI